MSGLTGDLAMLGSLYRVAAWSNEGSRFSPRSEQMVIQLSGISSRMTACAEMCEISDVSELILVLH